MQAEQHAQGPAHAHRDELRDTLAGLIGELPEPYATVLGLVELDGATLTEVAAYMGLGRASLRLLYIEGRRRLRDIVLAHTEAGTL